MKIKILNILLKGILIVAVVTQIILIPVIGSRINYNVDQQKLYSLDTVFYLLMLTNSLLVAYFAYRTWYHKKGGLFGLTISSFFLFLFQALTRADSLINFVIFASIFGLLYSGMKKYFT